jgi:AcrR family transcriptional regulator
MNMEERILRAASDILSSGGLQKLRIENLAREIGISKKTIYNHFPGKFSLIEATIDADMKRIQETLDSIAHDPGLGIIERMTAILSFGFQEISHRGKALFEEMTSFPKSLQKRYTRDSGTRPWRSCEASWTRGLPRAWSAGISPRSSSPLLPHRGRGGNQDVRHRGTFDQPGDALQPVDQAHLRGDPH